VDCALRVSNRLRKGAVEDASHRYQRKGERQTDRERSLSGRNKEKSQQAGGQLRKT